ncbi:MAG TPA: hypothetical protein VK698_27510 [Kofleriaceae bacterium]|nr:hypothetical protein [Kofleriaceae bacterium]
MRRSTVSVALLAGLLAAFLSFRVGLGDAEASPGTAAASSITSGAVETFPLARVRRGQVGYGLTTMQGTTPERFEFEVIGVTRNFLPKMDIILVRSKDKKLEVTGFWQGMSGSPLFIDGKLACAFSYGFRFNKVAIGGCTPIEYMKREGFKVPRNLHQEAVRRGGDSIGAARAARRAATPVVSPRTAATRQEWLEIAPGGRVGAAMDRLGPPRSPWLLSAPLPRAAARPGAQLGGSADERGMTAAAVPMAMSGFTAPAFEQARQLMARYPIEPMQAGGTGDASSGPGEFALGGAIAVQLVRGDMSAAATGTVSFLDGDGVLAFGHPLFQAGELYAPVAAAEIHTVIPSAMSAFIVASPLRELGTLVQDRQSTISADVGLKTRMIPVDIYIDAGAGQSRDKAEFHVEVLDNRFFTAALASIATTNAVSLYLPDRDHVTATMRSKVKIKGYEALQFVDYLYSSGGASGVVDGARGLRALVPLLMNPFAPLTVERVELRVDLRYDTNFGEIRALELPSRELEPGKKAVVEVELRRYDGRDVIERVPFFVPASLAGSIVRLEVSAGDSAALDAAPPESVGDLISVFRKLLPGNVYAVTLYTANEGAAVDGKVIRDLPSSALDKLHAGAATQRVESYRAIARSTSRAGRVINGKQSILVKIADNKPE